LTRHTSGHWTADDWQALFDERAGVAEFDRGYPKIDAELIAFEDCVDHWLALNLPENVPGSCLSCARSVSSPGAAAIEVVAARGAALVHVECIPKWKVRRRVRARTALRFLLRSIGHTSNT
jgi:hypothetical protein